MWDSRMSRETFEINAYTPCFLGAGGAGRFGVVSGITHLESIS